MALSRERVLELRAIVSDCQRFGDRMSRHTIIDIEEALMDLLSLQEGLEEPDQGDGQMALEGLLASFRVAKGDSPHN